MILEVSSMLTDDELFDRVFHPHECACDSCTAARLNPPFYRGLSHFQIAFLLLCVSIISLLVGVFFAWIIASTIALTLLLPTFFIFLMFQLFITMTRNTPPKIGYAFGFLMVAAIFWVPLILIADC